MKPLILLLTVLAPATPHPPAKPIINYTLHVDSTDLSGWNVEIRLRTVTDTFRLAMAAHPEYDDRYFRYVTGFSVEPSSALVTRVDSAVWQIVTPRGDVRVRYRIALPPAPTPPTPRASWRPFLTPTGGLIGGPHAFMYLLGAERMPATVTLELPRSWQVATGLVSTSSPLSGTERGSGEVYSAANAATLIDSPILVGHLRQWRFLEGGVPHRVVYWPLPDATPFDTSAWVSGIQRLVHQAFALFGRAPYREYTFLFEDGAFSGGLEHRNSVSLGAPSADLARDPHAFIQETAHEFVHTWNLMAIRPVEYRDIDYRTQPPVSSLWFSEGLTMFYADLLVRRAGLPVTDSTRVAHLERLLSRFVGNPAYERFSAESISRVAYNAEPGALGDYGASTHLQGELLGAMLDLFIRDASHGQRSMDDVMRLLFARADQGIDGHAIEQAVTTVCGCAVTSFFAAYVRAAGSLDYNRYLGLIGLRANSRWGPAVYNGEPERDLRIFGWEPGDGGVRIVITSPASSWGRAGLHSRDRLVSLDGTPVTTWPDLRARLQRLRVGDSVRIQVQRPDGPFTATVVVSGFERPSVRIEGTLTGLGQAWADGR
ncbi:MAG TPA: PDZ domain-containing protein [Gemmatimonadales bacterium]|nr:PDZ domain-containing protein [Gemmatimonadales bacterium]